MLGGGMSLPVWTDDFSRSFRTAPRLNCWLSCLLSGSLLAVLPFRRTVDNHRAYRRRRVGRVMHAAAWLMRDVFLRMRRRSCIRGLPSLLDRDEIYRRGRSADPQLSAGDQFGSVY